MRCGTLIVKQPLCRHELLFLDRFTFVMPTLTDHGQLFF